MGYVHALRRDITDLTCVLGDYIEMQARGCEHAWGLDSYERSVHTVAHVYISP